MRFEALKFVMRIYSRIAIIQTHGKPDVYNPVAHSINPGAAKGMRIERPAHRVNNRARFKAVIGHLPELLDPDRVNLWITIAVELQAFDHLLCKRTANSLAKHSDFCGNIDSGLEIRLGLARLVDALVARPDAGHGIAIVEHLRAGKFGEDINSSFFALLTEPAHHFV